MALTNLNWLTLKQDDYSRRKYEMMFGATNFLFAGEIPFRSYGIKSLKILLLITDVTEALLNCFDDCRKCLYQEECWFVVLKYCAKISPVNLKWSRRNFRFLHLHGIQRKCFINKFVGNGTEIISSPLSYVTDFILSIILRRMVLVTNSFFIFNDFNRISTKIVSNENFLFIYLKVVISRSNSERAHCSRIFKLNLDNYWLMEKKIFIEN